MSFYSENKLFLYVYLYKAYCYYYLFLITFIKVDKIINKKTSLKLSILIFLVKLQVLIISIEFEF